jgi:hypothetical protein
VLRGRVRGLLVRAGMAGAVLTVAHPRPVWGSCPAALGGPISWSRRRSAAVGEIWLACFSTARRGAARLTPMHRSIRSGGWPTNGCPVSSPSWLAIVADSAHARTGRPASAAAVTAARVATRWLGVTGDRGVVEDQQTARIMPGSACPNRSGPGWLARAGGLRRRAQLSSPRCRGRYAAAPAPLEPAGPRPPGPADSRPGHPHVPATVGGPGHIPARTPVPAAAHIRIAARAHASDARARDHTSSSSHAPLT